MKPVVEDLSTLSNFNEFLVFSTNFVDSMISVDLVVGLTPCCSARLLPIGSFLY